MARGFFGRAWDAISAAPARIAQAISAPWSGGRVEMPADPEPEPPAPEPEPAPLPVERAGPSESPPPPTTMIRRGEDGKARRVTMRARKAAPGEKAGGVRIIDDATPGVWSPPPIDPNDEPMSQDARVANIADDLARMGVPKAIVATIRDWLYDEDEMWIFEIDVESDY